MVNLNLIFRVRLYRIDVKFFKVYYNNNQSEKIMRSYEEIVEFGKTHSLQEVFDDIFPTILKYHMERYRKTMEEYKDNPSGYLYTSYMKLHYDSVMLGDDIPLDVLQTRLQLEVEKIKKHYTLSQKFSVEAEEGGISLNFRWVKIEDESYAKGVAENIASKISWKIKNASDSSQLYSDYNKYYQYSKDID